MPSSLGSPYQCAVIKKVNSIELETKAALALKAWEALIEPYFCGICGTDLAIYSGRRVRKLPYNPGHEYSGIIAAVGDEVAGLHVGDRVTANPNFVCGQCAFCLRGRPNLCDERDKPFFSNGAMSEYLSIDARCVYRLPDQVDFKTATLAEPLACALTGLESLPMGPADTVLILGAGMMGLAYLAAIREKNRTATLVIADPAPARRQRALDLADIVVDHQAASIEKALGKKRVDFVIECAGSGEAVKNALHFVGGGGTVLLVGRPGDAESIPLQPALIARNGITISGSVRLTPDNFQRALDWLSAKSLKDAIFLGRVFPLKEIRAAFDAALAAQEARVLLDCQALG